MIDRHRSRRTNTARHRKMARLKSCRLELHAGEVRARGRKAEPLIDTRSELITKENMYMKENQKLLVPFDAQ